MKNKKINFRSLCNDTCPLCNKPLDCDIWDVDCSDGRSCDECKHYQYHSLCLEICECLPVDYLTHYIIQKSEIESLYVAIANLEKQLEEAY